MYLEPPEGFSNKYRYNHVLKLKKSIYGLKQTPRIWYEKIRGFLKSLRWQASKNDYAIFINYKDGLYLLVYIDDIFLFGDNDKAMDTIKRQLSSTFKISSFGPYSYYLNMHVYQDKQESVFLHQAAYIKQILQRYELKGCRTYKTPLDSKIKLQKHNPDTQPFALNF